VIRRRVLIIASAAAVAVALPCIGEGHAHAAAKPAAWHNCARHPTSKVIGGLVDHNDHWAPGRSCITATRNGHCITVGTSYQPDGLVVAYNAIEFGRYPWSSDPRYGLPAPVSRVHTTMRVSVNNAEGDEVDDADVWFSRKATGTLHHVREMVIANRWRGAWNTTIGRIVHVGKRRWHVSAWMTGQGSTRHLLIRFVAARPSRTAYIDLRKFLVIARHRGWIRNHMTVDSAGYAGEIKSGGRHLSYCMYARGK